MTTTIGVCFLVGRYKVLSYSFTTSDTGYHTFGGWRSQKRKAISLEMVKIEEKSTRRTDLVYKEDFKVHWSNQRGYSAIFANFLEHTKTYNTIYKCEINDGVAIDCRKMMLQRHYGELCVL